MNKLQMAHEMALAIQGTKLIHDMELVSDMAWKYADAMQAEADKRNNKETCDKNIGLDSSVLKPSNSMELEWQPDWSQAPSRMNYFFMNRNGAKYWAINKPDEPNMTEHVIDFRDCGGDCYAFASSQNYQGLWQDSLRKRPQ